MTVTDPISDMLATIRNGLMVRKESVAVPASKLKLAVAKMLHEQGYLNNVSQVPTKDGKHTAIKMDLKYSQNVPVIQGIKRISRPGQKIYEPHGHIRSVLGGVGIMVISTSQGLMTDRQAREKGIGGEILFKIW